MRVMSPSTDLPIAVRIIPRRPADSVGPVTDLEPRAGRPNGAETILPAPSTGRVFRTTRAVRWGDVDSGGRVRLDAIARYLQDIATDDSDDRRPPDPEAWVVRRTLIQQTQAAEAGERLELATFCGGIGSRWAERQVAITGDRGASIDAISLWVHLDAETGRPKLLPQQFRDIHAEAAGGREVTARQVLELIPVGAEGAESSFWYPRSTDVDILDHVNNAIGWAVLEQVCARRLAATGFRPGSAGDPRADSFRAEIEFRDAIDRSVAESGEPLHISSVATDGLVALTLWSADGVTAHLSARFESLV